MAIVTQVPNAVNDAKNLQRLLNQHGYKLTVDGLIGPKTSQAIRDYQAKNGLTVDGIVGPETWGHISKSAKALTSNTTSLPEIYNPQYSNTSWDDTTKGQEASDAYGKAKDAVSNLQDFTFSQNDWLQSVKDSIRDYGDFSYDVNGDALYQQYKDQYIQQGKLAMADTMGQAAALTGGYGNSYAQTVGQQTYQGYLQKLNEVVPELYQMALDRYQMGKEDLYNQYGLLMSEYEREYGLYSDEYNQLLDALGIAKDDYYRGGDMFYAEQSNMNDVEGKKHDDSIDIYNAAYAENRDAIEDERWQKEFDAVYGEKTGGSSGGSSGGSASGSSGGNTSNSGSDGGSNYNNGHLSEEQVIALQKALGVTADGKYGPNSQKAAGGLSAVEAYKKYVSNNVNSDGDHNVTRFINRFQTKDEYLARNHSEKEFNEYMKNNIASFLRNDRITENDALKLIQYYGLS